MIADEPVVQQWKVAPFRFHLGGVLLDLDADDAGLIEEVASLLGRPHSGPDPGAVPMRARLRMGPHDARLELEVPDPAQLMPSDLLLAVSSPDFPFDLLESSGSRVVLARRGERGPALIVDGGACVIERAPGWRKAIALLLLQRLMRCRQDALFFHAGSVSLCGAGVLLVGAKGAGKSTLALSLALRGHALLGDENACYRPRTGELLPFRRPVGIKPGPRSLAVDARLSRLGRSPERQGMMRVPVEALLAEGEPPPAPLRAVVFLDGFADAPRLRTIEPARADVGRLQPVGSSMVDAPRTQRVFEMARLLARSRVYELCAGRPDETAALVEEALSAA